jgi:intracellular septation protein A
VTVHEPMTLATDYLLTVAAAIFAARLWRVNRSWALAFLFTALGSFFGGTYHGLWQSAWMWKPTVMSIGLASFFLLSAYFPRIAMLKFIAYASWMIFHDGFVWVIADYGITLLLVGAMQVVHRTPATPWVLGSIALSVIGALVQMSGFSLHRHFNYNDLYHVIQLAALWLLYRGGLLLSAAANFGSRSPVRANQTSDAVS